MYLGLGKIEDSDFYIDKAFRETKKIVSAKTIKKKVKIEKVRYKEISRIINASKILMKDLERIEKAFPTIDLLSPFYQDMIDITIGKDDLKKAISGVGWAKRKIEELRNKYRGILDKENKERGLVSYRKQFYGRVNSILKKIGKDFKFLDKSRKIMAKFPTIKPKMKTYCIVGYPNVGKSTLLRKLTSAKPEVNIYPFTTKGIMMGYIGKEIQIIDTPGAFNQPFKEMNYIEKQAYLAIKYLAKDIIYVFDLSESCGYNMKEQEKLFERINKRFKSKNFIFYLSKIDILQEKIDEKFLKNYSKTKIFSEAKLLKQLLEMS